MPKSSKQPPNFYDVDGSPARRLAAALANEIMAGRIYREVFKEIFGTDALTEATTLSPKFDAEYAAELKKYHVEFGKRDERPGIWRRHW